MTLAPTLDTTGHAVRGSRPAGTSASIERSLAGLRASEVAERAVREGDLIALPILSSLAGQPIDIREWAADRPVVLLFFWGRWCPDCTATLRAFEDARARIEAVGGVLIAVTPEQPERVSGTARGNAVGLMVAVDDGNRFARSLGLVAALPVRLRPQDRALGIDRQARDADPNPELPLPATYVLAPCGRVTWAHVDPDVTRRADPDDVVAALERLAAQSDTAEWAAPSPAQPWSCIL